MADKLHFQLTTADGTVCDAMASYVLAPLTDGDAAVMAGHTAMIGAMREGVVKYISDGAEHYAAISGGVLSVADNELILLARTAEKAESIDLARAKASESRARRRIEQKSADVDMQRAELSLKRALAREKAYSMLNK